MLGSPLQESERVDCERAVSVPRAVIGETAFNGTATKGRTAIEEAAPYAPSEAEYPYPRLGGADPKPFHHDRRSGASPAEKSERG